MKCKVSAIKGNLRYRMLTINNENYIFDMGQSFWRFLFPVFAWFFPHTVYKVNDEEVFEKLGASSNLGEKTKQKNHGELSLILGPLGVLLGSLIYPILDTTLFSNSIYINIIVITIPCISIIIFMIFLNIKFKKNLKRIIHFDDFPTRKIWIRPRSMKFMLTVIFYFLAFLIPSILLLFSYIQNPNTLPLILGTIMFFVAALCCFTPIAPGDFVVKFEKQRME